MRTQTHTYPLSPFIFGESYAKKIVAGKVRINYTTFGAPLVDRQWYANNDSSGYRFGYQNQEKDDEVKGVGNIVSFSYRVHDARLGRFLSVDPLTRNYAFNSPYAFSENSVIAYIELEGLEKIYFMATNDLQGGKPSTVKFGVEVMYDLKKQQLIYHGVATVEENNKKSYAEVIGVADMSDDSPLFDKNSTIVDKLQYLPFIQTENPSSLSSRWTDWSGFTKVPTQARDWAAPAVKKEIQNVLLSNPAVSEIFGSDASKIWDHFTEAGGSIFIKQEKALTVVGENGNKKDIYITTYRVTFTEMVGDQEVKVVFDYVDDAEYQKALESKKTNEN